MALTVDTGRAQAKAVPTDADVLAAQEAVAVCSEWVALIPDMVTGAAEAGQPVTVETLVRTIVDELSPQQRRGLSADAEGMGIVARSIAGGLRSAGSTTTITTSIDGRFDDPHVVGVVLTERLSTLANAEAAQAQLRAQEAQRAKEAATADVSSLIAQMIARAGEERREELRADPSVLQRFVDVVHAQVLNGFRDQPVTLRIGSASFSPKTVAAAVRALLAPAAEVVPEGCLRGTVTKINGIGAEGSCFVKVDGGGKTWWVATHSQFVKGSDTVIIRPRKKQVRRDQRDEADLVSVVK